MKLPASLQPLLRWDRVRPVLVALALAAGASWVVKLFLDRPFDTWLLPRYAVSWAATLLFAVSSYGAGLRVMAKLWPDWDHGPGRRILAFSAGMLVFFWGAFLVGLAGGLGIAFFFLWPSALLAWGLQPLSEEAVRAWDWQREARSTFRVTDGLVIAAGAIALGLVYLPILSPDNVNYDARWYHLGYAEHYTAAGRIAPIAEGTLVGSFPQFATVIYTWAFQVPGELFDKVELCLHIEFATVLATLASIPPLVRRLLPSAGAARGTWLAYFLFPGIFIYDTAVEGGADHAAAFWVVPAWIALMRGWRRMGWREAAVLAIPMSGLALTKYTALIAFVPLALALGVRLAKQLSDAGLARSWRQARRALLEPVWLLAFGLALTAAHWLKNLVFYGDPVYPLLRKVLPTHPWTGDSEAWHRIYMDSNPVPKGGFLHNVTGALQSLLDYHYASYNWSDMHGTQPAFGSLFTAGLLALVFLKGSKRTWALVVAVHLGIFTWFYVAHLERYLQVVVPWMVVVVAVVAVAAWQQGGVLGRLGVVALVAAQLVGQADLPFIPSHRTNGKRPPLERAISLLASGYRRDTLQHTKVFRDWGDIGAMTPLGSKVLIHFWPLRFGLGRESVTDDQFGGQYGLAYGRLGSPQAIDRQLKAWKVTHLVWGDDSYTDMDSLSGELLFRTYARLYTERHQLKGGWTIGQVPAREPASRSDVVLVAGCGYPFKPGLYTLDDVSVPKPSEYNPWPQFTPRETAEDLSTLVDKASYVAVEVSCARALTLTGFTPLGRRKAFPPMDLYARAADVGYVTGP